MSFASRYRSELIDAVKLQEILGKIKTLVAERKRSIIIQKGETRWLGDDLASITIDETAATNTIEFNDGTSDFFFDKADIIFIQRVRSRKYKIVLKTDADEAEAV